MSNVVPFETDDQAHNRSMAESLERWADMARNGELEGFAIAGTKRKGTMELDRRYNGCITRLIGAVECVKMELVHDLQCEDD